MSAPFVLMAADAESVVVLSELYRLCFPPEEVWDKASIAKILASPGAFGLIAVESVDSRPGAANDNAPKGGLPTSPPATTAKTHAVGFVLVRSAGEEAEVLSLGVHPECRLNGIGRALLRASMVEAHQSGVQEIFLEVAEDNEPARKLYEAAGFEKVGIRPGYYQRPGGINAAAHTMRRSLQE